MLRTIPARGKPPSGIASPKSARRTCRRVSYHMNKPECQRIIGPSRGFSIIMPPAAFPRHVMLSLSKHLRPFGYAQGDGGTTLRITMALPGPHKVDENGVMVRRRGRCRRAPRPWVPVFTGMTVGAAGTVGAGGTVGAAGMTVPAWVRGYFHGNDMSQAQNEVKEEIV